MCFNNEWRIFTSIVDLGLLPIICIVGLTLNAICINVFIGSRHHPFVPVLLFLSFCDSIQLALSLFVLVVPAIHDFSCTSYSSILGQLSYIFTGLLSPLLLASNSASIWAICFISYRRYKAIVHPLAVLNRTSFSKPLIAIAFTAILFNTPQWLQYSWSWHEEDGTTFLAYEQRPLKYASLIDHVLYPICVYLLPLSFLTILHIRIYRATGFSSRQDHRTSQLLLAIVVVFTFCHTGGMLYRLVAHSEFDDSDWFILVKDLINLLFNVNSTVNPLLYYFFTRQFRDVRSRQSPSSTTARRKTSPTIKRKYDLVTGSVRVTDLPVEGFIRQYRYSM